MRKLILLLSLINFSCSSSGGSGAQGPIVSQNQTQFSLFEQLSIPATNRSVYQWFADSGISSVEFRVRTFDCSGNCGSFTVSFWDSFGSPVTSQSFVCVEGGVFFDVIFPVSTGGNLAWEIEVTNAGFCGTKQIDIVGF